MMYYRNIVRKNEKRHKEMDPALRKFGTENYRGSNVYRALTQDFLLVGIWRRNASCYRSGKIPISSIIGQPEQPSYRLVVVEDNLTPELRNHLHTMIQKWTLITSVYFREGWPVTKNPHDWRTNNAARLKNIRSPAIKNRDPSISSSTCLRRTAQISNPRVMF